MAQKLIAARGGGGEEKEMKQQQQQNARRGNISSCIISFLIGYGIANFQGGMNSVTTTTSSSCSCTPCSNTPFPPRTSDTAFDKIVQSAYEEAIIEDYNPSSLVSSKQQGQRPTFNIDYWERKSKLTTNGGLHRLDRIVLGEIYSKATSIFEYGLGESTYMANYLQVPRYAGIDSDPIWVNMAREKVSNHFRFYLADIGPTVEWGFPIDENQQATKNVLNYELVPLIVEPKPFDVYMIDGRYRLASAIASFLHASARGGNPLETKVLVHDCKARSSSWFQFIKKPKKKRFEYDYADHLLNLTQHSGARLCIYKRFPNTTDDQLRELWNEYSHILK